MVELSLAEKRLLAALPADGTLMDLDAVVVAAGFSQGVEALRAAGGPERHGLVTVHAETLVAYSLQEEGLRFQEVGLPERRAAKALEEAGGSFGMGDLAAKAALSGAEVKVAIGWLKRKGWADIDKGTLVLRDGAPPTGADEEVLAALGPDPGPAGDEAGLKLLLDRGDLVAEAQTKLQSIGLTEAGVAFAKTLDAASLEGATEVNQVTPELVAAWGEMSAEARAKVQLRPFDFDVDVADRFPAKAHPLSQMMAQIRDIFWSMGFQEIAGDYVESAFWNMDALFIPQDHPARDMQDTFYLDEPARLPVSDEALARGRAVHETGGDTGSTGWGGGFDDDVSRRGLLRTHTTNTTIRYLAEKFHGVEAPEPAHKVFGLGKVFRKETMDATHLPEFYQIEGIVTEPGADFDMLIGLCRRFFTAMGFPEVRFRPAYFPYTEPSMEIDVWYNGKWMELGGCGIFRPEVTEPLDVPHPVLAWGFGLERLAMMRLQLKDIRDLYVSDVRWLKETPLQ